MKMDVLFGVDPGKSGGCAVSLDKKDKNLVAFPMTDITDLFEALMEYEDFNRIIVVEDCPPFAGKLIPSSAGFKLGFSCGQIEGLAMGMKIPCHKIKPRDWQNGLKLGGLKGKTGSMRKRVLKEHATRLFPHLHPTLKTADAILLTHYFIHNP